MLAAKRGQGVEMKTGKAFAAVTAAFCLAASMPLSAQPAPNWQRVHGDDEGEYFLDRASFRRDGDRVRVTMRIVPTASAGDAAMTYLAEYDFDCAAQTSAFAAGREIGPTGEELRAVTVPADRVSAELIYADSSEAPIYRALCPDSAALREPPAGPALIRTVPVTGSGNCPGTNGAACGGAGPNREP
jgi:hypothetical protein